jgi:hypothetical protein
MARVRNTDAYLRARELFVEGLPLERIPAALKKEGFVRYTGSTIKRWKAEAKTDGDDWNAAAEEHLQRTVEAKAQLINFHEGWAIKILEAAKKFLEKIEDDDSPKHVDANALAKLIDLVEKLQKWQDRSKLDESEAVRVLFDVMMTDRELAPILKKKWESILKQVDERMKGKGKGK